MRRARSSREDLVWRGFPRSRTSLVVRRRLESESATSCVYISSLSIQKIELEKNSNCVCFSSSSSSFTRLFTRNKYLFLSLSRREETRERRVAFSLFIPARVCVCIHERSRVRKCCSREVKFKLGKKCFRVSWSGRSFLHVEQKLKTTLRAYRNDDASEEFEFHAFLSLIIIIIATK